MLDTPPPSPIDQANPDEAATAVFSARSNMMMPSYISNGIVDPLMSGDLLDSILLH